MDEFLQLHQAAIYTVLFFGTFAGVALWEAWAPLRRLQAPLPLRWRSNLSLLGIDTVLIWAVYPGTGVGATLVGSGADFGLLPLLGLPYWWAFAASILAMDFSRYAQHFLLHCVPVLWRVHRAHHTDTDFDVTTAVRFHPLEVLAVIGAKASLVALIGPPVTAVLLYEFAYPMSTFWVHANVGLPPALERALRLAVITPEMHRTHHSATASELNSNFGGLFSIWDRLFGTYMPAPAAGHLGMRIGVPRFEEPRHSRLAWILLNPLLPAAGMDASAGTRAHRSQSPNEP